MFWAFQAEHATDQTGKQKQSVKQISKFIKMILIQVTILINLTHPFLKKALFFLIS